MAATRLLMRRLRELLRLRYDAGLSHRAIAQACTVEPLLVRLALPQTHRDPVSNLIGDLHLPHDLAEVRIPVQREHSFRFNVNAGSADAEHRFRSS